ncbi:hypothetical protein CFIMG_007018RA [Ceratocystis fimbriata CBS 114723]|uniref:Uncharacterized protein n=1 Tax=Ceratocystis fimbriata CBS 114723 TaxID=1035309 RepID=A0A2C5WU61_9PEZI|nr:hypothetical protein CFIMG_007018RA [Ceratocystis fimbriata CBS 114723]
MPSKLLEKTAEALEVLGFGRAGLIKRGIAARLFRGYQPARGVFATLQSAGAGGYGVKRNLALLSASPLFFSPTLTQFYSNGKPDPVLPLLTESPEINTRIGSDVVKMIELPKEVAEALATLGFGSGGLIKKSIAAKIWGGHNLAKGTFAIFQSAAAGGYGAKSICQDGKPIIKALDTVKSKK